MIHFVTCLRRTTVNAGLPDSAFSTTKLPLCSLHSLCFLLSTPLEGQSLEGRDGVLPGSGLCPEGPWSMFAHGMGSKLVAHGSPRALSKLLDSGGFGPPPPTHAHRCPSWGFRQKLHFLICLNDDLLPLPHSTQRAGESSGCHFLFLGEEKLFLKTGGPGEGRKWVRDGDGHVLRQGLEKLGGGLCGGGEAGLGSRRRQDLGRVWQQDQGLG